MDGKTAMLLNFDIRIRFFIFSCSCYVDFLPHSKNIVPNFFKISLKLGFCPLVFVFYYHTLSSRNL